MGPLAFLRLLHVFSGCRTSSAVGARLQLLLHVFSCCRTPFSGCRMSSAASLELLAQLFPRSRSDVTDYLATVAGLLGVLFGCVRIVVAPHEGGGDNYLSLNKNDPSFLQPSSLVIACECSNKNGVLSSVGDIAADLYLAAIPGCSRQMEEWQCGQKGRVANSPHLSPLLLQKFVPMMFFS
ncbi:unnamed protein product [Caenorhabditis auriculariae]|uniref:Uncharacterized protein n=1 Tax=Caenorhabditis auriculariae TaxID=2777116 RepID=A0A8S1GVN1_9PELO|nr:unnamed protein product [Caenorhabditis auriculariae]